MLPYLSALENVIVFKGALQMSRFTLLSFIVINGPHEECCMVDLCLCLLRRRRTDVIAKMAARRRDGNASGEARTVVNILRTNKLVVTTLNIANLTAVLTVRKQ